MLSRGNNNNHNHNNDNNDWSATNLYMRLGRDNSHCRRRRIYGCAATLVASNWAITAAHCVVDSGFTTKDDLSLVLGEFDISTSSDSNDGNRLKI